MSKRTRHFFIGKLITGIISFLLSWGLMIVFLIIGFATGNNSQSFALGITGLAGAVLAFVSNIAKKHWISPLIILMFGLYIVMEHFSVVLIVIGICIIVDEIIAHPLHAYFKNKYTINKEIDCRMDEGDK